MGLGLVPSVITTLPATRGPTDVPPVPHPEFRHYKPKDLALVVIDGRQIYLGKYGSPESWDEYHRLVKERQANPTALPPAGGSAGGCSVNELILDYCGATYYVKNGRPTSEQDNIRQAMRFLRPHYGHTPAREFSPKALQAVRRDMIAAGQCRPVVNKDVNRIRQMFRWAVEHESVPVAVHQTLQAALCPLRQPKSR